MLLLVAVFFFLFVLGAAGAGIVVYKVMTTAPAAEPIAKGDGQPVSLTPPAKGNTDKTDGRKDAKERVPMRKGDDQPPADDKKEKDPPKKPVLPKKDSLKKDSLKKDFVAKKDGFKPSPTNDPFPRRALLISVNHYLMFSTVHYGSPQEPVKGGYPGSSTAVLRDRLTRPPLYFPLSQVTELSDGVPDNVKGVKAHPTQKSVIETTIKDFVDTSREQDRILLLFAGHACSREDKSYLIPIDGNFESTDTLIPLQWVYDQLARCRAQQKLLILDTFRFSPGRGFELPGAGEGDESTMPEAFDKDLQNPPAGVQVWSSCQKEQSSVELDAGSAFMQALCNSLQGNVEMSGISAPTQPIPIETLVVKVNQRLKELLAGDKRTQMSRLTGKPREGEVAYNAAEPMPAALVLSQPTAAGGEAAGYAQVDAILAELLLLKPVRASRTGDINLLKARNLPAFSAKKLDGYKQDGSVADLQKRYKADKEAYAKEFPLRAAIFEAIAALDDSNSITTREVLPGPIDPKTKARYLQEQAGPGISILKLEDALIELKAAAVGRADKETSRRWQANFDYTQARLQSRLVYLCEYSYMIGQIRADNLPDLGPGHNGWRLGTTKKIAVTEAKAKAYAKDTIKLWKRIQDEYPQTPWSMLAQRESMISLGLQWRPQSD